MRTELDIIAEKDFTRQEGLQEGRQTAMSTVINKLFAEGISVQDVAEVTGLAEEEVLSLSGKIEKSCFLSPPKGRRPLKPSSESGWILV